MASLKVTVPCPSCAADIGFPGRVCPSCHVSTSRELRDALERRLEAADDQFRDARERLRSAASVLLVLGLLTLAAGLGRYFLETTSDFASPADMSSAAGDLVTQLALGSVYLGCAFWAKRSPRGAMALALIVWLGVQVAATIHSPISALPMGLGGFLYSFLRLVVFLFLVRGLIAAARGHAVVRTMTR